MNADDWSSFSLTFYYNAHITRVFRTWACSQGLESFLLERAIFYNHREEPREANEHVKLKDTFSWDYRHDHQASGYVLELIDKEKLTFSFLDKQVEVYFRVLDEQTEVQLVQTHKLDSTEAMMLQTVKDRSNWTFFMTNLVSVLEHNHDLRVQDPVLAGSMELDFAPMSRRR